MKRKISPSAFQPAGCSSEPKMGRSNEHLFRFQVTSVVLHQEEARGGHNCGRSGRTYLILRWGLPRWWGQKTFEAGAGEGRTLCRFCGEARDWTSLSREGLRRVCPILRQVLLNHPSGTAVDRKECLQLWPAHNAGSPPRTRLRNFALALDLPLSDQRCQ